MPENEVQTFFLLEIEREWSALGKRFPAPPWGVWIREYRAAGAEQSGFRIDAVPQNVWFLDKKGFRRKPPNDFQRFLLVQTGRLWNDGFFGGFESVVWSRGDRFFHELGLAAFAPVEDAKNLYYLEYIWGGRFGRGHCVDIGRGLRHAVWKNVWVS
ncbi:MAG: hypothetical protein JSS81_17500 [Acidobacteria bacterium]|nr:hypothetical protein [Acidobacteriota bacterium]